MASSSQPQSPAIRHSWTAPGHYLKCQICRDYRATQARRAEAEASRTGRLWAIGAGQPYRNRILSISPRLQNPRMRGLYEQQQRRNVLHNRHVTIQVPCLLNPVRPNQTLGLSTARPLGLLHQDSPSKKRPSTCTSTPEPAQYYVPGQYPDDLDEASDHQPNHQASAVSLPPASCHSLFLGTSLLHDANSRLQLANDEPA